MDLKSELDTFVTERLAQHGVNTFEELEVKSEHDLARMGLKASHRATITKVLQRWSESKSTQN